MTSRTSHDTGKKQLYTPDILGYLRSKLPATAYCLLGITLHDLYTDPAWNFVFGQASLKERVGVYSFARYDPRFYGQEGGSRSVLVLRRSCKILAHEATHMFGVNHCVYFQCVLNGSNSLEESDARPLHLCPVDLRKLYASIGLDPVARYAHLRGFCRQAGFAGEAAWIDSQLRLVSA